MTKKQIPITTQEMKELPVSEQKQKAMPKADQQIKEFPQVGIPENTVMIGGKPVEIKPTKVKYQRNRTATFYRQLEIYPLTDIMSMEKGAFGDDRDGDKAVMDWLIAVTDDENLILSNYDDMDTGIVEKMLSIFKRVNKIDEKDEKLKNMEKDRKGAV